MRARPLMYSLALACLVGCAAPDDHPGSPAAIQRSMDEGAAMTAEEAAALAVKVAEGTATAAEAAQLEGFLKHGAQ